jgi:hypothetical protein
LSLNSRGLLSRVDKLERARLKRFALPSADYPGYRDDPAGFAQDVLGLTLTPGQLSVLQALQSPPRRVLVSSGHSVGKTLLGAVLILWYHYTRYPSLCLTTAPTERQVKDQLWKEVRLLASRAGLPDHWVGPKIPRLQSSPDHFAHGFTALDATRFQGHHSPGGVCVIFDEAEGVEPPFWQALKTMLDDNSIFVAFYNPTGSGTGPHLAEQQADEHGLYKRLSLSCVDHPNVKAALKGLPLPLPGAITLGQLESMLIEDSLVLSPADPPQTGDVSLNGKRYRPGPIAEARCLGRRPSTAITGLWGEQLWKHLATVRHPVQPHWPIVIGCDVGRYGDDSTVIVVRKGFTVVHIESHVKQGTDVVARRLRELCEQFKDAYNPPRQIPVHVDEGGIGGGVIDQADKHLFIPINAARRPRKPERFAKVRDELWFTARQAAQEGLMDISHIQPVYLNRLKTELFVASYQIVSGTDKIKVSSKDDMKAKLGRSPDIADAFNLCYYPVN